MKLLITICVYFLLGAVTILGLLFVKFRGKNRSEYNDICYANNLDLFSLAMIGVLWPFFIAIEAIGWVDEKLQNNKEKIFDDVYKVVNVGNKKPEEESEGTTDNR